MHGFVRFISGPGQVYKRFRNLLFCNLIGQFKLAMVEIYIYSMYNIILNCKTINGWPFAIELNCN